MNKLMFDLERFNNKEMRFVLSNNLLADYFRYLALSNRIWVKHTGRHLLYAAQKDEVSLARLSKIINLFRTGLEKNEYGDLCNYIRAQLPEHAASPSHSSSPA